MSNRSRAAEAIAAPHVERQRSDIRDPRAVDSGCTLPVDGSTSFDVQRRLDRIEQLLAVTLLLAARNADPTHVSVAEAARALGISIKSVRRRIAAGGLTLEAIPGTKRVGIPLTQLYDGGWWLPLDVARQLVEDERQELALLKRKSR